MMTTFFFVFTIMFGGGQITVHVGGFPTKEQCELVRGHTSTPWTAGHNLSVCQAEQK